MIWPSCCRAGVVPKTHVVRAFDLEEAPRAAELRPVHVVEQVVLDEDVVGLLAELVVVAPEDVEHRPTRAGRCCCRKTTRCTTVAGLPPYWLRGVKRIEAVLRRRPVVLEDVALDEHVLRVLQLEEVLDRPGAALPLQRLRQVVAHEAHAGGHEVGDARVRSAQHEVLAGPHQVVVLDVERPGPVPAGDRLRVLARVLEAGDVAVDDARLRAVEGHAAPHADVSGTFMKMRSSTISRGAWSIEVCALPTRRARAPRTGCAWRGTRRARR
jgi:hypothetical protein